MPSSINANYVILIQLLVTIKCIYKKYTILNYSIKHQFIQQLKK